jgi:hypothetical protein
MKKTIWLTVEYRYDKNLNIVLRSLVYIIFIPVMTFVYGNFGWKELTEQLRIG